MSMRALWRELLPDKWCVMTLLNQGEFRVSWDIHSRLHAAHRHGGDECFVPQGRSASIGLAGLGVGV